LCDFQQGAFFLAKLPLDEFALVIGQVGAQQSAVPADIGLVRGN
jgi:hypothetical protein